VDHICRNLRHRCRLRNYDASRSSNHSSAISICIHRRSSSNSGATRMNAIIPLRFLTAAVCVVILTVSAVAAEVNATFSGPVLGYVFDSNARKLRPLSGILGNAITGTPVEPGFGISSVLTLDANQAIVSTDATPELLILNLGTNPISTAAISGIAANPTQAAASFQGTAAAFYYAGAQHVLIVTGLPRKPAVVHTIDLSRLGRPLTHMAVSNDGTLLVYAVDEGGSEAVHVWSATSGSERFLTAAVSIGGIALTENGAAIVADRGANEVFAIW